ncbi:tetratricopeptide repeat protein [Streptomyces sp. CA-132043]|uniref:tetratricopeptide repeat protein n=1 Tax=Streptomyces sp. CA-132043 TaxID=3240048 RepID=UPI003D9344E3
MRQELLSLPKTLAEDVARNLVMVAKLLDEDPEKAYGYSRVALRLASRVAAVREAAGFAAYAFGKYSEALAEFRAARRMTGSAELWPVMADCERGIGRPEKALAMAGEPEVQRLDKSGQVEMRLVAAGARRDMGQADAAVVTLQSPELASHAVHPWTARLRYAYADALLAVGREDEAREWFAKALEADQGGTTDASDRLAELDGVEFTDALSEDDEEPEQHQDEDREQGQEQDRDEAGAETVVEAMADADADEPDEVDVQARTADEDKADDQVEDEDEDEAKVGTGADDQADDRAEDEDQDEDDAAEAEAKPVAPVVPTFSDAGETAGESGTPEAGK